MNFLSKILKIGTILIITIAIIFGIYSYRTEINLTVNDLVVQDQYHILLALLILNSE